MSNINKIDKIDLDADTLSKLTKISHQFTQIFPPSSRIAPDSSAFEYTEYRGKLLLFVNSVSVTLCDMTANDARQFINWSDLASRTPTAIGPGTASSCEEQERVSKYVWKMAEFCEAVGIAYSKTEEWWADAPDHERLLVTEVYNRMDKIWNPPNEQSEELDKFSIAVSQNLKKLLPNPDNIHHQDMVLECLEAGLFDTHLFQALKSLLHGRGSRSD
jgi:hypothetical protein